MLSPKKVKHRKVMRGKSLPSPKMATRMNTVAFGEYGLVSLDARWVTARQIEAARIAATRHVKRGGQLWIRIFPDIPYTKKPLETRMGKGKGAPSKWMAAVSPGCVMYEIAGVSEDLALEALKLAGSKLPVHTKLVKKGAY